MITNGADQLFHVCSSPECRVAETGKCIEGYALGDCPHYGNTHEVETPVTKSESPPPPEDILENHSLRLAHGETLKISEANQVLCATCTRVIAIVAPSEAGKTTLIAALYDLFQDYPLRSGAFRFASSRTLRAFEQACHYARARSQRIEPHTERTTLGSEVAFYHLGLQDCESNRSIDFLLADRAGEYYRSASDDPQTTFNFVEVARADTITLLADGSRLLDAGDRHNVRVELELILQGLMDGNVLGLGQNLAIVLTKLDEIERSDRKDRVIADFDRLAENIQRRFESLFNVIKTFHIAASPKFEVFERGYGLNELLKFWTLSRQFLISDQSITAIPKRAIDRIQAL